MMFGPETANRRERRLLKRFRALGPTERETLEAFADFLVSRQQESALEQASAGASALDGPLGRAEIEPRPEQETVIAAMKRLRRSYPELDAGALLNDASLLMSAHLVQGRPAPQVIDELEALFTRHAAGQDASDNSQPEP